MDRTMAAEESPRPPEAPLSRAPELTGAGAARNERLATMLTDHYRAIWRAVRRLGVPSASAEDAAQEVFIIASRKLDEIVPGGEARFLYGVALRVAANRRRSSALRHERSDEAAVLAAASSRARPDALLEEKQMRELLELALAELPEDLRAALVLFEIEGFSEREIADIADIPLGTVASRLRRARAAFHRAAARLRALLESREEES